MLVYKNENKLENQENKIMYLPYVKMTAKEDRIGNLMIWSGENQPMPKDDNQIAYIQTTQDRESIFSYCFGLETEDTEELEKGYSITINLHEDIAVDIFC